MNKKRKKKNRSEFSFTVKKLNKTKNIIFLFNLNITKNYEKELSSQVLSMKLIKK